MKPIEKVIPGLYALQMIAGAMMIWAGCAGRQAPRSNPPQEKFWHDCRETVPANADGFQHFVCTDVKQRQWEVLVRREGK